MKKQVKRPMTKIEKAIALQLYTEFDNKFGYSDRNHIKVSGQDLSYPIQLAIGCVTIRNWNHKEAYKYWCSDEHKPWIGSQSFRKIYERVQELLVPRINEINAASWYRMNFIGWDGENRSVFLNADNDHEAMKEIESYLVWSDIKPKTVYRATWDGCKFVIGSRVSMAA